MRRPSWHAALEKAAGAEAFLDTSLGALIGCCRRPITDRQIGHVWVPAGWFASAVPRRFFLRQARGAGEAQIPAILRGGQPDGSIGQNASFEHRLGSQTSRRRRPAGTHYDDGRQTATSRVWRSRSVVCTHCGADGGGGRTSCFDRCCPSSKQTDSPMGPVPSLSNGVPASAAAAWKRGLVLGTRYKA